MLSFRKLSIMLIAINFPGFKEFPGLSSQAFRIMIFLSFRCFYFFLFLLLSQRSLSYLHKNVCPDEPDLRQLLSVFFGVAIESKYSAVFYSDAIVRRTICFLGIKRNIRP